MQSLHFSIPRVTQTSFSILNLSFPHKIFPPLFFYKWNGIPIHSTAKAETGAPPFILSSTSSQTFKLTQILPPKYHSNLTSSIHFYHRLPFLIHKLVKEHLNYVPSLTFCQFTVYTIPEFFQNTPREKKHISNNVNKG